jgi:hypothetical protein
MTDTQGRRIDHQIKFAPRSPLDRSEEVTTVSDSDVLWGAEEIGQVIGRTARQTFHLLESGHLPAKRIGGRWCGSRRKILAAVVGDDSPEAAEDWQKLGDVAARVVTKGES